MTKPKKAFWFLVTEPSTNRKARVKMWSYERARQIIRMFELQDYNCGPIGTVTDDFTRDQAEIDLAVEILDVALHYEVHNQVCGLPTALV